MKNLNRKKLVLSIAGGCWARSAVVLTKAVRYGRAARRDERSGFPYTAAVEWRHAAELFVSGTFSADYCWRQWERIMHLPRQIAGLVEGSRHVIVPLDSTSVRPSLDHVPTATAA